MQKGLACGDSHREPVRRGSVGFSFLLQQSLLMSGVGLLEANLAGHRLIADSESVFVRLDLVKQEVEPFREFSSEVVPLLERRLDTRVHKKPSVIVRVLDLLEYGVRDRRDYVS